MTNLLGIDRAVAGRRAPLLALCRSGAAVSRSAFAKRWSPPVACAVAFYALVRCGATGAAVMLAMYGPQLGHRMLALGRATIAMMDRENVKRALAALPQFEREILEMRFGLTGATPRTLQDVGAELDIAPEQIREIENHALRLLADTA